MWPWSFSTLTNIGYVFVHAHANKYWLCFRSFFMRDNFSYWWSSVGCMLCVRLCGIYSLAPDAYVMDESTTLPGMASMNSVSDENAMTIKIQTTKKCSKYKVKEVWIELIEKAINDLNVFFVFMNSTGRETWKSSAIVCSWVGPAFRAAQIYVWWRDDRPQPDHQRFGYGRRWYHWCHTRLVDDQRILNLNLTISTIYSLPSPVIAIFKRICEHVCKILTCSCLRVVEVLSYYVARVENGNGGGWWAWRWRSAWACTQTRK